MTPAFAAHRGRLVLATALAALLSALIPGFAHAQAHFGVSSFDAQISSTQAGAHADLTTAFTLNTNEDGSPAGQVKDMEVALPSGIVGNPRAIPKCSQYEYSTFNCPAAAKVGVLTPTFVVPGEGSQEKVKLSVPVYNLTPLPGHVATFGASLLILNILIQVDVRNDGSYGLTARIDDLATIIPIAGASLTLWGVPADPSHSGEGGGSQTAALPPAALLTNSTNCSGGPANVVLRVDSWQDPASVATSATTLEPPSGCELLQMAPALTVTPETTRRDTPAGYDIDIKLPQNEEPYGLATPALRTITIVLPAGTSLSPSTANGLESCSETQAAAGSCPGSSKLGQVRISSPILPDALTGGIYLGQPTPSEPYRLFVTASADNVTIKLSGQIQADATTGQLTAVFDQNPQQPLSDIQFSFFGGPAAVLANPSRCGAAATTAQILSYGGQTAAPSSSFIVDADGRGGACPAQPPFQPRFAAGTLTALAGAATTFSMTVAREDGEQGFATISAQLPPGLVGMLSSVRPCPAAQAAQGSCSPDSRIGSTTVAAGAGSEPLQLLGSVYLTGPHGGAPFGLAIVVPAVAGPFDLGTIVIGAQIAVSPSDAHLTIVSDPLPRILNGIPLRLRTVNLTIDRHGFIVNPTDCSAQIVAGSLVSEGSIDSNIATPFYIGGCRGLPFAPKLAASMPAMSRRDGNGASLDVNVSFPAGPHANIHSLSVQLPGRLQSRLSTLQQACRGVTFSADPAACPAGSVVGRGTVSTPLLSSPLSGPVYLVSHGRSAPPALAMVLRSQGVAVELDGALRVSKTGITSSVFRGLPDIPIASFELNLPAGPHSALGATAPLCSKPLWMPYEMDGQNGMRVKRAVTVRVSGCRPTRQVVKVRRYRSGPA